MMHMSPRQRKQSYMRGGSRSVCLLRGVIAQREVADELMAKVKELSQRLKAGDHINDPSTNIGPVFAELSAANLGQKERRWF
jgi:acyl-CoA reductase-like NAD-dependent aldehyde dehydrogenase